MSRLLHEFGELRSLMQMSSWDVYTWEAFWALLCTAKAKEPDEYRDVWVPYLRAFAPLSEGELQWVKSFEHVRRGHEIDPSLRFGLWFSGSSSEQQGLRVQTVASSESAAAIEFVVFKDWRLRSDEVEALTTSTNLVNLTSLVFNTAGFDDGLASDLLRSPLGQRLEGLGIIYEPMSDVGLAACEQYLERGNLRRFSVAEGNVTCRGLTSFLASPVVGGLQEIFISHEPGYIEAFATSAYVGSLQRIKLQNVPEDDVLRILMSRPFNELRELQLEGAWQADTELFLEFFEGDCFPKLEVMRLGYGDLALDDIKRLVRAKRMRRLRELHLDCFTIGTQGAFVLAASPSIRNLQTLSVDERDVGEHGLQALIESPFISRSAREWLEDSLVNLRKHEALVKG